MKRFLTVTASGILAFGLACGLAAAQSGSAQGDQSSPPQGQSTPPQGGQMGQVGPMGRMGHRMTPDEQLQRMSERLNLTDDQKEKIKPILEDRQKQMEALRSDTSLSPEDRRAKMHSLMQETHSKISAVLTEEQRQKLNEMRPRRRRGGMMGQPGASSPPPSL